MSASSSPVQPPPGEPGRSLRLSIIDGGFCTVHGSITTGSLVTAYALMLGAGDFQLGALGALSSAATAGMLLTATLLGRLGRRRPLIVWTNAAGRGLWALLCVLPLLPVAPAVRIHLFLATIFFAGFLVNMAHNAWMSWMTDLVPAERRGRYFGIRNMIHGVIGMAAVMAAGRFYDAWHAAGNAVQAFAVLFGVAAVAAWASSWFLHLQWEPTLEHEYGMGLRRLLVIPFRHSPFRRLIAFNAAWILVTAVAAPFWGAHMIRNLGMPLSVIAWYSIGVGTMSMLAQPVWGRIIDRVGNRPVLIACMGGIIFLPLLWLPARPGHLGLIWVDSCLSGLLFPGFGLALFNLLLLTAPRENRTAYFAAQSMVAGLVAFAAGLGGGWIAERLAFLHMRIGPQTIVNFHILFVLSSVGRLAILPLAFRLSEDGAASVGLLIARIGDKLGQGVMVSLRAGVALVRNGAARRNGRAAGRSNQPGSDE